LKVIMPRQDIGPKRQPRHVRNEVEIRVAADASGLKTEVPGAAPMVSADIVDPNPGSIGLQKMKLEFWSNAVGDTVFDGAADERVVSSASPGALRLGTFPLKLRITVKRAKLISSKRIVLAVNPKVLPADANAPQPRGPAATQPPTPRMGVG
jgi:hypothetical protein